MNIIGPAFKNKPVTNLMISCEKLKVKSLKLKVEKVDFWAYVIILYFKFVRLKWLSNLII
ncbi:hypothetical protein MYP_2930 [Sporocytophaga myxococcoides]|uniref:Uncharacterized protein n=1 Tax=Sporocytophaga myxococcoides TaxID=153721 RepID=A0A098LFD6_9BACT|nr:hypothetical protein MYP_2930 [Sporocytophaga myxococcoides]